MTKLDMVFKYLLFTQPNSVEWCKYLKMAFCPRSAQKIFWWLKSASRATALRNCSTICVYSRLSSPSFRMSLRFVKIRQGSLPAMQEMELKVLPGGTSNNVGSLCWRLTKFCLACLHYECVHVHPLDVGKGLALVIKWHQAKQPSVYIKETDTLNSKEPRELSWSMIYLQHTTQSHLPTALHTPVLEFIW